MSELDPFAAGVEGVRPDDAVPDTATPVDMDVGPILGRCVDLLKAHPGLVIFTIIVSAAPGMALAGVGTALQLYVEIADVSEEIALAAGVTRLGLNVVNFLIVTWLQLGAARIFLNLARGGTASLTMIVGQGRHYFSALIAVVLLSLAFMVGLILFVVPAIIIGTGLQFYLYAMVDKNLGPIEALAESWRLTRGHKLTIFLINLVFALGGTMFCCATLGLGYLLVVPLLSLASAVMYHTLTHLDRPQ